MYENLKETSDGPNLLDDIANAEVIVIYANPADSESELNPGDWECVSFPYQVNNCDIETMDKYKIPVAPVFEMFNGLDYVEDPVEKGYILPDGLHTTADGSQVIADALQSLGYEISQPPQE